MEGHIYTIAKIIYLNGLIRYLNINGESSVTECAKHRQETIISGNQVVHPEKRVKELARFAQDLGLLYIQNNNLCLTPLGEEYSAFFQKNTWELQPNQVELLTRYIFANHRNNRTVFSIYTLFLLVKDEETVDINPLSEKYARLINKQEIWNYVTRTNKTRFALNYLKELQLLSQDLQLTITGDAMASRHDLNNSLFRLSEINGEKILLETTDDEFKTLLNQLDTTSSYKAKERLTRIRKENRRVIDTLKRMYNYSCQICGHPLDPIYGVSFIEAHHIDYFSISQNSCPDNIVIVCPNHHRLIHASPATFDRENKRFVYSNGYTEPLILNKHL